MNTVYSLFQNVVAENRDRTAIIENDRTMTFGELSNLADLIAGSLPERITSVGIVMSHRAEMIAAILAVLKCGASYVPAEPNFPPMCFTLPARQDDQREFVSQTVMSAIM